MIGQHHNEAAFLAEIKRVDDEPILLGVHPSTIVAVVGALQLALRHPDMQPGGSHSVAVVSCRYFIDAVIESAESNGWHAIAAALRMGDDPACDLKM